MTKAPPLFLVRQVVAESSAAWCDGWVRIPGLTASVSGKVRDPRLLCGCEDTPWKR